MTRVRHAVATRIRRRRWPVVVTMIVLSTGMAYGLLWGPLVRHVNSWIFSGDIWSTYRSAHFIAWGAMGSVYAAGTGLVTFPGLLFLLAPLAALTGHLGMTESFPYFVPHPTAWLLLGPYEMLIGCVALFALDALAEALGVSVGRRVMLCVAQGVLVWPTLVFWGHPEDALALGFAVYALTSALDGRWQRAGWLFGAAAATQPLVLLVFPVALALAGRGRMAGLVVRAVTPAALLLALPLAAQFGATTHALVDQPNFPRIDHFTPWTFLAPTLGGKGVNVAVAAGPGRIVAVLGACAIGWWARRWKDRPDLLVWAVALALSLRCLTESVMVAYYVWPTLAVSVVVLSTRRWRNFALGAVGALGVTVCSQTRLGEWPWWLLVNGGIVVALVLGIPLRWSRPRLRLPIDPHTRRAREDPQGALVGVAR